MITKKLTGRENLTMYAFWLGHGRPTDKENLVKMNKKYHTFLGTLPLRNSKDPDPY
jgi:hypothetical protein